MTRTSTNVRVLRVLDPIVVLLLLRECAFAAWGTAYRCAKKALAIPCAQADPRDLLLELEP
jgi:hypothetical protein